MKKQVVVMVNDKDSCNINCTHCYLPYSGKRSPEDTVRLIESLQEQGYQITIAGSETLMDREYLPAYQAAHQEYILTNGILLHQEPELFDELSDHALGHVKPVVGLEVLCPHAPRHINGEHDIDPLSQDFPVSLACPRFCQRQNTQDENPDSQQDEPGPEPGANRGLDLSCNGDIGEAQPSAPPSRDPEM